MLPRGNDCHACRCLPRYEQCTALCTNSTRHLQLSTLNHNDINGLRTSWILSPTRILVGLSVGVAIILAASFGARGTDSSALRDLGIVQFLDVDKEGNLPTAFSGALLALAASLLYLIGFLNRVDSEPFSKQWLWLGLMFSYLSIDELAGIHELFNSVGLPLRRLGWSGIYQGFFRWPWVLVGIIAVISISFVFRRFVRSLPKRTYRLFLSAATLYISGAIGMEMLAGRLNPASGGLGLQGTLRPYLLASHAEEALEMMGVVVFIYALLDFGHPFIVSLDETQKRAAVSIGC